MRLRLVGSLIGLVALATLLVPASALARSLTVTDADVQMRLAPDAALLVNERLEIDFDGQWQAAYRDILLKKGETMTDITVTEGNRRYQSGGCTVEGCTDAEGRFGAAQIPTGGGRSMGLRPPPPERLCSRSSDPTAPGRGGDAREPVSRVGQAA